MSAAYKELHDQDGDGLIDGASGSIPLESFSTPHHGSRNSHESFEDLELYGTSDADPPDGTSDMKMAFMNMANSILGAGIIGQPLAVKNSGLLGGILTMVFLAALIDWTVRLIIINANLSQTRSYQDTVGYCFGKFGKIFLLVSISSFAYGGCMAFCVIIGDTIPHVLTSMLPKSWTSPDTSIIGWLFERNVIIVVFTVCISYPLSLNRDISKLAKASAFALLGMSIIVAITVIRGPFVDESLKATITKSSEWLINSNFFQGISVISFALVCHHNSIFIYNSMKNASIKKFSKLTHWACAISLCYCLLMGVMGFLNFGSKVKGNFLNNFKSDDKWINVARFCFGLNMLTTFPLEIFVIRDVLKDLVLMNNPASSQEQGLSQKQHFVVTTVLVFTSMSVSLFTCNLGMILELIGATSASLMAYIIPPSCYIKLSLDAIDLKTASSEERKRFYLYKAGPSVLCIIFGFAVMFVSSYKTIKNSLENGAGSGACIE